MNLEARVKRISPPPPDKPLWITIMKCCREWPIAAMHPIQRCGICKQVPR